MNEKSKLLSQLKIDRDEQPDRGLSIGVVVVLVLIALGLGLGIGMYFMPTGKDADTPPLSRYASEKKPSLPSSNDNTPKTEAAQVTPEASAAKNKSDQTILDASGYITARRIATVSAELTGLITDVLVEEGMVVKKGQILARLDDAIARVNLDLAKAQMTSAKARVQSSKASFAEAKRVFARVSKLQSSEFSSEARLTNSILDRETTRAGMASAIADLEVARLEVSRQQERLDDHTIRAPFSGVVTIKNAQPGEIVSPGSAGGGFTRTGICTIVDMASLEIEADVNEAFIGRISAGQRVSARLDAYSDWEIPASVIAIIPTANRNKATVRVRIKLEVSDPKILPDMGVKISFYKS